MRNPARHRRLGEGVPGVGVRRLVLPEPRRDPAREREHALERHRDRPPHLRARVTQQPEQRSRVPRRRDGDERSRRRRVVVVVVVVRMGNASFVFAPRGAVVVERLEQAHARARDEQDVRVGVREAFKCLVVVRRRRRRRRPRLPSSSSFRPSRSSRCPASRTPPRRARRARTAARCVAGTARRWA